MTAFIKGKALKEAANNPNYGLERDKYRPETEGIVDFN